MKQQATTMLQEKYVSYIGATPILFTAPHSKTLKRPQHNDHKKQTYTNLIAADLAVKTGKNSFLFWGYSDKINDQDLDPNYLEKETFHLSPFHQALHAWALKSQGKPLFHVDIHGKADRPYNCEIQIGMKSMEVHWLMDPLVQKIRKFFQSYEDIFAGMKFGHFECKINTDPCLHGYWGSGVHTMTEQAIILGIPSIQIQIPLQVRKKITFDQKLAENFSKMIKDLYQQVIKPDCLKNQRKRFISEGIGNEFKANVDLESIYQIGQELFERETQNPAPVEAID